MESSPTAAERQAQAGARLVAARPRLTSLWQNAEPAAVVVRLRRAPVPRAAAATAACAGAASGASSRFGLTAPPSARP